MAGDVTGTYEEEPMRKNLVRNTIIAAVLGGAGLALAGCGAPASTITEDGTYTVGSDIAAGTLAKESISGAAACMLTVKASTGTTIAVSQAVQHQVELSGITLEQPAPTVALKAVPLVDGQTVQVKNCGTLVIQ
jgi:hypothetical protein